jgi:hypothetical protein
METFIQRLYDIYDPWPFRENCYWNERSENLLLAFEPLLMEVYRKFGGHHKKPGESHFMMWDEFESLILSSKILDGNELMAQRDIVVCYNQAMFT